MVLLAQGKRWDIHHTSHICQEFEKNWEESRQGRVDSWLNFKGVTPKVSAPAAMGPGQARQQQPQQLPGHTFGSLIKERNSPSITYILFFRWRKS